MKVFTGEYRRYQVSVFYSNIYALRNVGKNSFADLNNLFLQQSFNFSFIFFIKKNELGDIYYNRSEQHSNETFDEMTQKWSTRYEADKLRQARECTDKRTPKVSEE